MSLIVQLTHLLAAFEALDTLYLDIENRSVNLLVGCKWNAQSIRHMSSAIDVLSTQILLFTGCMCRCAYCAVPGCSSLCMCVCMYLPSTRALHKKEQN